MSKKINENKFTKEQITEIKKGISSGIDINAYAKPNILPNAMRGIREFLTERKKQQIKYNSNRLT